MVSRWTSMCPSVRRPSVHPFFLFPDDNLSKHQWIFTKLGMCIDNVKIWFGIANGQILSNFYGVICPQHNNGEVLLFNVLIWTFITRNTFLGQSLSFDS